MQDRPLATNTITKQNKLWAAAFNRDTGKDGNLNWRGGKAGLTSKDTNLMAVSLTTGNSTKVSWPIPGDESLASGYKSAHNTPTSTGMS